MIPILSLAVAVLAVFVGPLLSQRVARRQVVSSLEVANKQIIAPMRQVWINNLRNLLAELASSALHYYVAGYEDRTDEEYAVCRCSTTRSGSCEQAITSPDEDGILAVAASMPRKLPTEKQSWRLIQIKERLELEGFPKAF